MMCLPSKISNFSTKTINKDQMVYNEFSCCVNARENNHVLVAGDMLDKIHFCDITIIFNLN